MSAEEERSAVGGILCNFDNYCVSACGGGFWWLAMGCSRRRSGLGVCELENEGSHLGRQRCIHYGGAAFAERTAELFFRGSSIGHSYVENVDVFFGFQ